jgi:hypothetical protein
MASKAWDDYVADFERDYPDTDLYFYFGRIRRPFEEEFISDFDGRSRKRKNILVLMTTLGGDPHAAYRMGRCIQRSYGLLPAPKQMDSIKHNVSIFVDTVCASAGTLVTFGGNCLIMTDLAEISPIDIQIRKPDDIWERDSGLTPAQALDILERRSKSLFKTHFNQLRLDSELGLTTKTSVEVASNVTTGLLQPIYGQIDPMRLGEVERLMGITASYGERLGKFNLNEGALGKLLSGYPSHDFVIDRWEATDLFKRVEEPKPGLRDFAKWMRTVGVARLTMPTPLMFWATKEPPAPPAPAPQQPPQEAQNDQQQSDGPGGEGAPEPRARRRRTGEGGAQPNDAAPNNPQDQK